MSKVSQRSIVATIRVLNANAVRNLVNYIDLLYERDFPDWFIYKATRTHWDWRSILIELRSRRFMYQTDGIGSTVSIIPRNPHLSEVDAVNYSEFFIGRLAAFGCTLPDSDSLRRSLELDGFEVDEENLRLVPIEGPVSVRQEQDRITKLVTVSGLANAQTIVKHLADAQSLYVETGKDHASLNESRNFLQALINEITIANNTHGNHQTKMPGGLGNRIAYLTTIGFLTPDEKASFDSAWGSLSAGSHPGVPQRDQTRIGLILALEFGQILLLKFPDWKANAYKAFSAIKP